ncbi:MAG: peptidylprolyl isomerase [Emcibacter sp.]|nr:peptidylprolyl isomerase [Emcibacter sp.]
MNSKIVAKLIKLGLAYIVGIFLLSPFSGYAQEAGNQEELYDVQQIVAVVNDSPISLYDLKQRVLLYIISSGNRQLSQEEIQYLNQQALQSLVDDKLKTQEAEKYKTVVSNAEQEESFTSYAQQMRLTPQQMEQQLNQAGIRKESMLKQIEASLAWDQVVGGLLMPQVSVSDEEINAILDRMNNNKGQLEYHPLEIFLLVSDNEKRDETRLTAQRIIEQLKKKASFQVMARQFSQSTTSAVGGDLGWLMKSQISPDIITTLEKMEEGDISDPIETEDGFYILLLAGKRQILTADKTDAQVELQHLYFEVSDKAQSDELEALEKIIANAAAKIENCDNLEEQGEKLDAKETGSLGKLAISDLPKNLHQPILDTAIGHATAPIKETSGYRVFVVCDRQDPVVRLPDYDSVEGSLSQQRVGLIARRHLRDLRRDAIIDYK